MTLRELLLDQKVDPEILLDTEIGNGTKGIAISAHFIGGFSDVATCEIEIQITGIVK